MLSRVYFAQDDKSTGVYVKPAKSTKPPASRPRNAAATRAAILQSARRAFARAGYDGAGVREIATDAGVTAMLINRYFGSKEQLFAEVVVEVMRTPTLLADDNLAAPDLAKRLAQGLVAISSVGTPPLEGFALMLSSATSEVAAKIARAEVDRHYQRRLASALHGRHADERAGLVFALVTGVVAMRQALQLPALAAADPRALARLLEPLFAQLLAPP
jgi:AcrR family transcriptional regulator